MTWVNDQSAHFLVHLNPLNPDSSVKPPEENQQIPRVLLETETAEGKSLFQQPVMMISHNLVDRLHIGQMR